jgi:hypothetical protein
MADTLCQSWVGFTIGTFEFEYPTGKQCIRTSRSSLWRFLRSTQYHPQKTQTALAARLAGLGSVENLDARD